MIEHFEVIDEFPKYAISNLGTIIHQAKETIVKPRFNYLGYLSVGLVGEDGVQQTRSVPKLVLETFVEKPKSHFDTVIHHDYDFGNVSLENLAWRPRWFAISYHRQGRLYLDPHRSMSRLNESEDLGEIECYENGLIVGGFYETAIEYGILEEHLFKLALHANDPELTNKLNNVHTTIFPTNKHFIWLY